MNKQLYELAKTAGLYTKTSVIVSAVPLDQMLQKFAELVLDHCVQLAEADEDRYLEIGEPDLALAMANYQALLKQQFKVEK